MNSKTGFKQTEIGKIPEDWGVMKISELDPSKDTVLTGPFGSLLHARDYSDEGVPLLLVKNIDNGRIVNSDMPKVNYQKADELKRFYLKEGDIVFTRVGAVGRTFYVNKEQEGWMFSGQTLRIRIRNPKVNNKFVEYFFRTSTARNISETTALGTTRPSINTSILSNRNVPIPPKKEQDKILEILERLDDKHILNNQMNKTLEAIGQALFKHWFIDFEFPNENGKPYKSSGGEMVYSEELEKEIPKGWEVKPIDKIAHFLNGLALQKYPVTGDEYLPVIKIREMKQGITENTDKASPNIPEEYVVNDGDILFSWSGSLGICIWGRGKGALNQHLFKVTSDKYPKWFFYYWIEYYLPEFRHIAAGKATTMGHIKRNHLSESFVVIPPNQMIEKLNNLITPTFNKIIENSIELRYLELIRDTLLPKLMSGKIRVKVTETEATV